MSDDDFMMILAAIVLFPIALPAFLIWCLIDWFRRRP